MDALLRKPIVPRGLVSTKGSAKSRCTSRRRLKKEFPDLPDEPQISFPGVGGLSNDEMTILGHETLNVRVLSVSTIWKPQRQACMITLCSLGSWADAEWIPGQVLEKRRRHIPLRNTQRQTRISSEVLSSQICMNGVRF